MSAEMTQMQRIVPVMPPLCNSLLIQRLSGRTPRRSAFLVWLQYSYEALILSLYVAVIDYSCAKIWLSKVNGTVPPR